MKAIRVVLCFGLLALPGCGLLAGGAGVEKDDKGQIHINENSPMDRVQSIALGLGPWGIAVAGAIGIAKRVIRHREIIANGQKDDDLDGIPDEDRKPKASPT